MKHFDFSVVSKYAFQYVGKMIKRDNQGKLYA